MVEGFRVIILWEVVALFERLRVDMRGNVFKKRRSFALSSVEEKFREFQLKKSLYTLAFINTFYECSGVLVVSIRVGHILQCISVLMRSYVFLTPEPRYGFRNYLFYGVIHVSFETLSCWHCCTSFPESFYVDHSIDFVLFYIFECDDPSITMSYNDDISEL